MKKVTYTQIIKKFKLETGKTCKSCWIADRKCELLKKYPEYIKYKSRLEKGCIRKHPCPARFKKILDKIILQLYGAKINDENV